MLPADRKGYGSTGEYFPLELMVMVMFVFQVSHGLGYRRRYDERHVCLCFNTRAIPTHAQNNRNDVYDNMFSDLPRRKAGPPPSYLGLLPHRLGEGTYASL